MLSISPPASHVRFIMLNDKGPAIQQRLVGLRLFSESINHITLATFIQSIMLDYGIIENEGIGSNAFKNRVICFHKDGASVNTKAFSDYLKPLLKTPLEVSCFSHRIARSVGCCGECIMYWRADDLI